MASSVFILPFSLSDLTLSPVHHAAIGLVHPSRGISVRMPRYIRSVPDRSPEDCSTATDIATMFKAQTRKMDVSSEGQEMQASGSGRPIAPS
jgi:DNA ligase-1